MRDIRTALLKMSDATRVKAGALLLLGLTALLTNLSYLRMNRGFDPRSFGRDEITVYERRFDELKKSLPERGVVGYVSDETDADEETKRYYLTQYALAPLVVVRGADRPLVVANFGHDGTAAAGIVAGLTPIKDFGNGVRLYGQPVR